MLTRRAFLQAGTLLAAAPKDAILHEARVSYELDLLRRHGVLEPMAWAAEFCRQHPPATGVGAIGGSLVAYCLGLTRINPASHGLFFERFLNPERETPPDVLVAAGARPVGRPAEPWGDAEPVHLHPGIEAWGLPALDCPGGEVVDYLDTSNPGKLGCKELIKAFRPASLNDYALIIALYRPGPLQLGIVGDCLDRRRGRQPCEPTHPLLEPILKDTYGVWAYQEQLMKAAIEIAGFTATEADQLRRAIGKRHPDDLARWRRRFLLGSPAGSGTQRIYDEMLYFGGYTFSKAHALAWADMAMRASYRLP